jgi:hypothetical protein
MARLQSNRANTYYTRRCGDYEVIFVIRADDRPPTEGRGQFIIYMQEKSDVDRRQMG